MTGVPIPPEMFSHGGAPGLLRETAAGRTGDATFNFTRSAHSALPPDTTAAWTGELTVPKAGVYWLCLEALGVDAQLALDGKTLAITGAYRGDVHGDILQAGQDNVVPTPDGLDNVRAAVPLTAGAHAIRLQIRPDTSHAPAQVRLNWSTPDQR